MSQACVQAKWLRFFLIIAPAMQLLSVLGGNLNAEAFKSPRAFQKLYKNRTTELKSDPKFERINQVANKLLDVSLLFVGFLGWAGEALKVKNARPKNLLSF